MDLRALFVTSISKCESVRITTITPDVVPFAVVLVVGADARDQEASFCDAVQCSCGTRVVFFACDILTSVELHISRIGCFLHLQMIGGNPDLVLSGWGKWHA